MRGDPLRDYDRWYRSYRRRRRIIEAAGYIVAGFAIACIVFALYVLVVTYVG